METGRHIQTEEATAAHRIFGLDLLRCYAVLMVMWLHAVQGLLPADTGARLIPAIHPDPVGVFFLLSGYLIGSILVRKVRSNESGGPGLLLFLRQRFLRIGPLYFFMLAVYIGLNALLYGYFVSSAAWTYCFFIQNFRSYDIYFFLESWSLSVEVWFYIAIAAITAIVCRVKPSAHAVLWAGLSLILAGICIRIYKVQTHPPETTAEFDRSFRLIVTGAIDYPAYGVLAAYIHAGYRNWWAQYRWHIFLGAVVTGLVLYTVLPPPAAPFRPGIYWCTLYPVPTALFVLASLPLLTGLSTGSNRVYRAVTYISRRSYALYLVHSSLVINIIFNTLIRRQLELNGIKAGTGLSCLFFVCFWVISLVWADLAYRYIELPFMQLRQRQQDVFRPARGKTPQQHGADS